MQTRGVESALSPKDAVAGTDWVFSAVTADQSLEAARAAAPFCGAGQVFFDINSVSPARKRDSAALFSDGVYVDMAVMAPVHPRGHATPVLIAGGNAARVAPALSDLGFSLDVVGPEPGAATAIKMVRSLFVKGLEAITVEALLAAQASGCFDYVLQSLTNSYPGLGWPEFASYQFERTTRHGKRRAAEMRESAATLNELGLTGQLADAIADVQMEMGQAGGVKSDDLREIVRQVLEKRLA